MKNHIKLFLSEIGHKANFYNKNEIIKALNTVGYYYMPNFISKEELDKVKKDFDKLFLNEDLIKYESNNCDKRIYAADKRGGFVFKKLEDFSKPLFNKFSFFKKPFHFLLLGWIVKGEKNLGSGSGWHRDSPISHQFKTIVYLTDVDENNGPFQYVSGSNNWKNCLKVSKELNVPMTERRFKDEQINNMIRKKIIPKPVTFTSKAGGLIIVDTRGLHRGAPLTSGERKAVTTYHFTSDIGDKFFKN